QRLRFNYARSTPWTRRVDREDGQPALLSLAGPDAIVVAGPLLHRPGQDDDGEGARAPRLTGTFELAEGETRSWALTWFPSHQDPPPPLDPERALAETVEFWGGWAAQLDVRTDHQPIVLRSLLVLRALTHLDTGGIVAAPTASLPELFGGGRNWDYRYTWLRDAAFTIEVSLSHGLTEGATLWRNWLL